MSLAFISVLPEDEDVINIQPYENCRVVPNNVIDDALEHQWCIAEAGGHDNPFEGQKLHVDGSFSNIFVVDSDLVQPTYKADL